VCVLKTDVLQKSAGGSYSNMISCLISIFVSGRRRKYCNCRRRDEGCGEGDGRACARGCEKAFFFSKNIPSAKDKCKTLCKFFSSFYKYTRSTTIRA